MASQESNNLQRLIERLENVTNRLESVSSLKGQTTGSSSSSSSAAATESFDSLPSIAAYDDLNATLSTFTKLSCEIGKDVETMVKYAAISQ